MFSLTPAAAQQVLAAANASAASGMALRIAARRDADGTIQYGMGFDEPNESDLKLTLHDVEVVIGIDSQVLLDTTQMDYVEMQPGQFHFIFIDEAMPTGFKERSASRGCGGGSCGGGSCGPSGSCR